ncbi:phage terminase small subunit [Rhodococcus sp. 5G237]
MAGRGPAPKDPSKRARRNADPVAMRVITADPTAQPGLPEVQLPGSDEPFAWPEATQRWWKMWGDSPLAADFTANDWSELLDTALLHARFWSGDVKVAGELRLRVAKFGATPEDRARLRIQFAAADEADEKRAKPKSGTSRQRRGPLKAV